MRKPLPLLQQLLAKNTRFLSICLFLVTLLFVGNRSIAQVYYLTSDGNATTLNVNDAINRMDYNGGNNTRIVSSLTNSPAAIEQDLANNRLFVYEGLAAQKSIKVVNASTGAITASINVPYNVSSMKYDAATDYIYFLTTSGAIALDVSDALYRVKPTETTPTLIASSVTPSPTLLTLDIANNRVFFYEAVTANRSIKTFDLNSNSITQSAAVAAGVVDIEYDETSGYIYYLTTDGSGTTLGANDALNKTLPGAASSTVIKSQVTASPGFTMLLDAGNNRAYIYEGITANRAIKAVDLTTGDVTTVISIATYPTGIQVSGMASARVASLTSTSPNTVTATSATLGGNISRSDASVSERGIVYSSSNSAPAINASGVTKAANGSGTGAFSSAITGLSSSTTYYACAYATSTAGTSYGAVNTFTTLSNDNNLSAFSISAGTLSPAFAVSTINYTASVANSVAILTVTPTKNNANANVKVNGTSVNSGTASGNIALSVGSNTITILVTAQDNSTKTYTVTVTRAAGVQSITFNALAAKTYGNADFSPGATASSSLPVTYTSSNTAVATIINNQIHLVANGTTNITASQAGNANYSAATDVVQSLTVNKATVNVTAYAKSKFYGDADPGFGFTVTGVVGTDSPTGDLSRPSPNDNLFVGTYPIELGTLSYGDKYIMNYVGANFTINKRPITVLPSGKTKVYGDVDPNLNQFSVVTGSIAPGDATGDKFGRAVGENVGRYLMSLGTKKFYRGNTDVTSNYDITVQTAYFDITAKPITVTANPASKAYGTADPTFTYAPQADITDATFTGNLSRVSGEEPGKYALLRGNLQINSNYTFTFVADSLTIGRQTLIVTPDAATKVYGNADPQYTYTTNVPIVGNSAFTGTPTRAAGKNVGTYAIDGIGTLALDNPRYTLTFAAGGSLTITKRPLTFNPVAATKSYGNNDPTYPYRFLNGTSVAPGEGITGVFGRAQGENVGTYALTLGSKRPVDIATSTFTDQNYEFSFVSDNLTITPRRLDITANNLSKSFGDVDPAFTYYVNQTLVGSDAATGTLARAVGESRGTYAINQGTLSFGNNYQVFFNSGTFTIGKKTIDVAADALNKTFGDTDPTLTYTTSISPVGESFTGALARTTGENFGTYTIAKGTLSLSDNYTINFTGANFDINKKTINVIVNAQSKTYGTVDPQLTYSAAGLVGTDSFTGSLTRTNGENVGRYLISGGSLSLNNNYELTVDGAYLTIDKATLTYSAAPTTRFLKTANPTFTGNVTGFVNGETLATATTGIALFTTTADLNSPAGTYAIVGSGLASPNYAFIQDAANSSALTIIASPDNTLSAITASVGALTPAFSPSALNYNINVANAVKSVSLSATPGFNLASVTLNGTALSNGASTTLPLVAGQNQFDFTVTAQDETTRTYRLNIYRALSTNNLLSSLVIPGVTFTPAFDPNITTYSASIPNSMTSIDLFAVAADSTAVVLGNNGLPNTAQNPLTLPISVGEYGYSINVKSQSGTDRAYSFLINRARSSDASLTSFGNSTITLTSPIVAGTFNYTANVPYETSSLYFIPVANNTYDITVNGQPINIYAGNYMPIGFSQNLLTVVVTAQDGTTTQTYTLNIIRAKSAEARLGSLIIPFQTTLNESFSPDVYNYTANLADSTITGLPLRGIPFGEFATMKINGTVVARFADYFMTIHGGANTYNIEVIAQDGSDTTNYTLVLTRAGQAPPAKSPNAALYSVNVNNTGFSKNFNLANEPLEPFNVPNSISSVNLFLYAQDAGATAKVNGVNIPGQNQEYSLNGIALVEGYNLLNIVVTAEDGVATNTYKLEITRLPFVNVSLAALTINKGTLSPTFTANTTTYTVTVPYSTKQLTLTPVAGLSNATISVTGGAEVNSENLTSTVNLNEFGTTRIRLTVRAADGVSTKIYSLTVTKGAPATNASLNSFAITPKATLTLAQSGPASINYATSVPAQTNSITLTSKSVDPNAVIRVNGVIVASGAASEPIALPTTSTVIDVLATAEDGITTKTYSITVNKVGSSVADLTKFVLNPTAAFTLLANGPANINYETSVVPAVQNVTLTSTAVDPNSTISVNGIIVASGVPSQSIALTAAATLINVVVTAEDGTTTRSYSVNVKKSGSSIATLDLLRLNPLTTITPTTNTSTSENFTASVLANVASISLMARAVDANAIIRINGTIVATNTASAPIALNHGDNVINVLVTAENGTTTRTYTITVNRQRSANAQLAKFTLSPTAAFTLLTSGSAQVNYGVSVSSSTQTVRLASTSVDANATIRVNGTIVASGVLSAPITLQGNSTTIAVLVTAEDGVATRTYNVVVNKAGSSNATLNLLRLSPSAVLTLVNNGPASENYTANVAASVSSVTLTSRAVDANAVIKVNGTIVASNAPSGLISIGAGTTTIQVLVTAEDNASTKTYSIAVTRASAAIAANEPITKPALLADLEGTAKQPILVHQGLSPNGDGNNDVLIIDGINNYPDNKLRIMNRSGLTIFEAKGYNNSTSTFDGHANNGQLQTAGTYFYILEYKDDKTTKRKTGYIVIKY